MKYHQDAGDGESRSNVHAFPCHQPNLISPSNNFLISNKIIRIEFNTPNVIYIYSLYYMASTSAHAQR